MSSRAEPVRTQREQRVSLLGSARLGSARLGSTRLGSTCLASTHFPYLLALSLSSARALLGSAPKVGTNNCARRQRAGNVDVSVRCVAARDGIHANGAQTHCKLRLDTRVPKERPSSSDCNIIRGLLVPPKMKRARRCRRMGVNTGHVVPTTRRPQGTSPHGSPECRGRRGPRVHPCGCSGRQSGAPPLLARGFRRNRRK